MKNKSKLSKFFSILEDFILLLISLSFVVFFIYQMTNDEELSLSSKISLVLFSGFALASIWVLLKKFGWVGNQTDPSYKHLLDEIMPAVSFDDTKITLQENNEKTQKIAWNNISKIIITIDDSLLPTPIWCFQLKQISEPFCFSNDAKGIDDLMDEFKNKLTGFNDENYGVIISAMGAMEGTFGVWSDDHDHRID